MERISATELARRLGDILGRIRYRGEVFLVERNGSPVATIGPLTGTHASRLSDALAAWRSGEDDPSFADDLERVSRADAPPSDPWGS